MYTDDNKGIIDATNRILRVLLKKPAFKNNIRSVLNSVDPDNARDLARTIIWEDPEIILSLVGAVPALANSIIKFLDEVILQVMEKFPPELLHDFLETIIQDVDRDAIKRIRDNLSKTLNDVYFQYDSERKMKGGTNEPDKRNG